MMQQKKITNQKPQGKKSDKKKRVGFKKKLKKYKRKRDGRKKKFKEEEK